ncbi:Alpha/Beta hydrolase protein [Aspergillus bertholletiae]|uniref:feruloyl esterase n=1 Tax=Aspergillus bertholletiae TaxID=1226010 RepID=A0A5N7BBM9_9EURO|nr:Alpha/Beta hydrolase protein [Aspergillus bertholletiae]
MAEGRKSISYCGRGRIHPGGTTGYLALDKTNKYIVLSFRGTVSVENRNTDLDFQHVDASSVCKGCQAHHGFWEASKAAMGVLLPKVEEALHENPDYRIVLTGHSLGGALATLGAVTLRNAGHTVDLVSHLVTRKGKRTTTNKDQYSFGAPSVGNKAFADYITQSTAGKNYRITHTSDEVPKVLFRSSRRAPLDRIVPEYSQSSPEYWITSPNGVSATKSDIRVIEGVNNEAGNLGTPGITMDPHGWYMGDMSVCAQTWKDWE